MESRWLIYGSYGYTGNLIARQAVARGLRPVLAGRNPGRLQNQARELGLECVAFSLDNRQALEDALKGAHLVLNCAGPFSRTFRAMTEACLRTGTHYLDITGEISVFESLAAMGPEARAAGIMLLPGVGFDVVPSDCLAAHLKERLPSATHLALAFQTTGRASRGTMLTALQGASGGGLVRQGGVLTRVPTAWRKRDVDFGKGPVAAATIPWGDVSTAFHSTGIPNIEVYAAFPRRLRLLAAAGRLLAPLLRIPTLRSVLTSWVRSQPPGPTEEERRRGRSLLWGEVRDDAGETAVSRLGGPDGYSFTALTALAAVERVLAGEAPSGFPDAIPGLRAGLRPHRRRSGQGRSISFTRPTWPLSRRTLIPWG